MGCSMSRDPKITSENAASKHLDTRRSATETKINQALLKKKMENVVSDKPMSFEKILLKFDKLRIVIDYVRAIFNEVATDGKLDHSGLQSAMKRLEVNMTLDDILDLFDFIDVQETKSISLKEFLVALTIGMVLDVIPALAVRKPTDTSISITVPGPEDSSQLLHEKPVIRRSFSGLMGHNSEIKDMLNLIVNAYLIFDPDGKGYIEKSGVHKLIEEQGSKGKNPILSQQRWDDMDWDGNGTIDFAEFVFSFTTWLDIDEE